MRRILASALAATLLLSSAAQAENLTVVGAAVGTAAITGGTINNATVGATTATTGRFTSMTLSPTSGGGMVGASGQLRIQAPNASIAAIIDTNINFYKTDSTTLLGVWDRTNGGLTIGGAALTTTAGTVALYKITTGAAAPGAAGVRLEAVCGTNAGSAKLIMYAGTSTTPVTVVDNVGSGVTGC